VATAVHYRNSDRVRALLSGKSATACRGARGLLAGVAIGVAAHLAFFAAVPLAAVHVPSYIGHSTLWLIGNALACLGLARLALRR
jgi:hypothetical protein